MKNKSCKFSWQLPKWESHREKSGIFWGGFRGISVWRNWGLVKSHRDLNCLRSVRFFNILMRLTIYARLCVCVCVCVCVSACLYVTLRSLKVFRSLILLEIYWDFEVFMIIWFMVIFMMILWFFFNFCDTLSDKI